MQGLERTGTGTPKKRPTFEELFISAQDGNPEAREYLLNHYLNKLDERHRDCARDELSHRIDSHRKFRYFASGFCNNFKPKFDKDEDPQFRGSPKLEELFSLAKDDMAAREEFLNHYICSLPQEFWGEAYESLIKRFEGISAFGSFRTAFHRVKSELGNSETSKTEMPFGINREDLAKEIGITETPDPAEFIEKKELQAAVNALIVTLPGRKQRIIIARYFEGKSLEEVAKEYGISKETIRQIEQKAFLMLYDSAAAEQLKDFLDHPNRKTSSYLYNKTLREEAVAAAKAGRADIEKHSILSNKERA